MVITKESPICIPTVSGKTGKERWNYWDIMIWRYPNINNYSNPFILNRLHILGAPGSGVTSLGKELADRLACPHFDTDNYHWFTEDALPYRRRRNPDHRRQLLSADLNATDAWVLSGSLCGWGDVFIPSFDAVVYLWLPADVRVARIRERELKRYGAERLAPGGDLHMVFEKFVSWAAAYDDVTDNIRSRSKELEWLEALPCSKIIIEAEMPLPVLADSVLEKLRLQAIPRAPIST
jgi:adenylate kinase family enzyme